MKTIRLLLVLPCVLLGACQMTTFEQPPLPAQAGCEPALAGRWESVDDEPGANPGVDGDAAAAARTGTGATPVAAPELVLLIDAACTLSVEENSQGGVRRGESTRLHLAADGGHRYAWVDAGWAMARFREEHRFPAGDILLLRYTLDGDRLEVASIDDKAAAHAIIDGELTGEVRYADSELFNRLTGEQAPAVLARDGLFDAEPGVFRRAGGH